ncbi:30S ribosomal protein S17 [Blattabacterium sp. (Cryptocercus punctulatus) str. Cpu]|uniref:30S ribosomal protein S17 n=1 Tax=Blattabacterium sp. (Cryptocercus punctulatus) str. Cpu TaxID=1075399 RepID=UPI00023872D0|nr:30S ribosomal protein S17 [Blattabacterium sp. (Cryptocercus punctulatus) str. Cpu]AEU09291.1 30S ribosomal protein S17 [Blattabacterium sp. (Cryptocercus punctulatus) str. Cpu]
MIINQENNSITIPRRNSRKQRIGIVVSNKMNKTIIVSETKKVKHKYYGKSILKKKKYMVHDEENISKNGDKVKIMEIKPISKNKCWRLISVLGKIG